MQNIDHLYILESSYRNCVRVGHLEDSNLPFRRHYNIFSGFFDWSGHHLSLGIDVIGFGAIGRELARRVVTDEVLKKSFVVSSITDSSGTIFPKTSVEVLKAVEWKASAPGKNLDASGVEKKSGKAAQIAVDVTTSDYKKLKRR